jgi:hypothetical protein
MTRYSQLGRLLLIIAWTLVSVNLAQARRMIPDDNLAYPVLIILQNKNGTTLGFGSGFYFGTANAEYLVTAKHVIASGLPDEKTQKAEVPDLVLRLVSYSKDLPTPQRILLSVDFKMLLDKGDVKWHKTRDVATVKLGSLKEAPDHSLMTFFSQGSRKLSLQIAVWSVPGWLQSESLTMFWSATTQFCTDTRYRWGFPTRNNSTRFGRCCDGLS